jgi:putative transposase
MADSAHYPETAESDCTAPQAARKTWPPSASAGSFNAAEPITPRNALDHLPQSERSFIGRKLDQAWKEVNAERAEAQLRALAKHLEVKHPGAAASLLEGLEETLTVTRLDLSPSLLRTFKSTNPVESMISIGRTVAGNVKRWRDGKMVLRWTAAGLLEAEKQFRRVNGYREMAILRRALDQHYQGLASTRKIA